MIHRAWPDEARVALLTTMGQALHPRTPGVHASDLYGRLHARAEKSEFTEANLMTYRLFGLAFENVIDRAMTKAMHAIEQEMGNMLIARCGNVERPGEVVSPEGIICSPDALAVEKDGLLRVLELKATWKSFRDLPIAGEGENGFPPKFAVYFTQIMFYCSVLGTQSGRLIVFFTNGNWRPSIPALYVWDLEFTRKELQENYDALIQIAHELPPEMARSLLFRKRG